MRIGGELDQGLAMASIRPSSAMAPQSPGRRSRTAVDPHRDLTDALHLICFLETSRASRLAACQGEARPDYGLALEPEDEPAGSSQTRLHLAGMLYPLVQADDHLAPALHIQLAEQVVDMQLRCRQADVQPTSDLLVTEPRRNQLGCLPFAPGERGCRG
jgi:hypothetical protein